MGDKRSFPRRYGRLLGLALLLVAATGEFSPWWYSIAWHWRHGDTVLFENKQIPVPRGWIASSETEKTVRVLTLLHLPKYLTLWGSTGPWSRIAVSTIAGSARTDQENQAGWAHMIEVRYRGFDIGSPREVPTHAGETASCVTLTAASGPARFEASCFIPKGASLFDYMGTENEVNTFFEVVSGTR